MPPVAVAVAASAAGAAAAGAVTAGFITTFGVTSLLGAQIVYGVTSAVVAFGINTAGGALLSKKPKKPGAAATNAGADLQQGIKQVVRLSDDTYKLIYGRARVGGTLAYIEASSSGPDSSGTTQTGDNLFLHMVIIHAGHEVTSFDELYLNDDRVTVDANGFVQTEPYLKDGKSYVRIKHHYGYDTQTADADLVMEGPNWTVNHRLRGLAYTYVRLQWNSEIFTNGIPTFNAVIKGKKVYDPRAINVDYGSVAEAVAETVDDGSVASTVTVIVDDGSVADSASSYGWTDNAALCIRDYLSSRDPAGVPYGFGATDEEVNDTYTIAAANICDEFFTKLDASTIKRYTINGVVDTAATPIDNLESMITALAGAVTNPKGQFRIHAGAYDTPESDVIDESWLAGRIRSRNRIQRQDLFNAVRGKFINPDKDWQKDDFPQLVSPDYEAQDNGERIYTDIELPYTTDAEAAQRIAKIAQRKGREQISVTMALNYRALQFTVWDNVKVTNATRGWSEKVFRIVRLSFDLNAGVVLDLREENSASYDWNTSDAEAIASAPDTNLPNAFDVTVPDNVRYNSRAVDTAGGDMIYNLVLSWDEHGNAFVRNGGQFEIQFKLSADTAWRPSFFVGGALTTSDIVSSSVNVSYDLRIRAINMLGRPSNWITLANAIVGTSGGVTVSNDWGNWTVGPGPTADWGDWTTPPSVTDDWGYFS